VNQEINVKGMLIVTKSFLKAIESVPERERFILNLTSVSSQYAAVTMDSYTISKVAVIKFTEFLAAEYPSITSINLDPGMVATDMGVRVDIIAPFLFDTVALVGGAAVWLCSGDKKFLSGRYVSVNWDVDELERRKDEIMEKNLLSSGLRRGSGVPADELVIHP
jgi:NAD(P)-dependent dehydrogenase (short-subunit alcohol dehydrogenase family)